MDTSKCDVTICYDHDDCNKEIIIPEDDRFLNTLIIGPTGTGKSSQVILPMIMQDVMRDNCGITIIDPKEDLAEAAYAFIKNYPTTRRVFYLNPTLEDGPKINPFEGEESTVIKNLLKIFSPAFILKDNNEKQSFDICRNLISKSIKLLKASPELVGNNLNIKTYSDFISNRYNEARVKINKLRDALLMHGGDRRLLDCCEWFLYKYFEPLSEEFVQSAPVRVKIEDMAENKYISRTMCPDRGLGSVVIDFNDVLSNGDIVIVNTQNTILGPLGKTFGEFIMLSFLNAVFNRKHYGNDNLLPHFLYVDEFATFSPVLTDMFTQGRSFRVGTHIAVQNRTLLQMCGEMDTRAQSMLIESNARNLILFPGLNGEDADYYSKQFYTLSPEEICYRPFGQICYRIVQNKNILPPAVGLTFFIDEQPSDKSLKNEAIYHYNSQNMKKRD